MNICIGNDYKTFGNILQIYLAYYCKILIHLVRLSFPSLFFLMRIIHDKWG